MSTPAYTIDVDGNIKRTRDGAAIPHDPANRDCAAYLAYLAQGGTTTQLAAPAQPSAATVAQDRLTNDYLMNGLVAAIAAKLGMTADALAAAIVAQVTTKEANDKSKKGGPGH